MADNEGKSLTDIILSDKTIGPLGRIFSAPWLRSEEKRIKDLGSEILSYKDNGIEEYLDELKGRDPNIGKQVHDEVFLEYTEMQLKEHRPTVRWAEFNDTLDKFLSLVELAADATILGIPAAGIMKGVEVVFPLTSIAVTYFNTVRKNKDPETKHDQATYYTKAALGLIAVEASEFVPIAGDLVGNALDIYDLYVIMANQTIAKGTSRKQFEQYFQAKHPELYDLANGGPIIDAVIKEAPTVAPDTEPPELPELPPESQ